MASQRTGSIHNQAAVDVEGRSRDVGGGVRGEEHNRRRHLIKLLIWDGSGYWVFAKRLERGTFAWPATSKPVEMRSEELSMLLGGIDLGRAKRRRWFDRQPR